MLIRLQSKQDPSELNGPPAADVAGLIVILLIFVPSFFTYIPLALDHFGRHDRLMAC